MRIARIVMLCLVATAGTALVRMPEARACLWDSDTLEAERRGIPDVLEVLTGRFARNPPLWFEMRLERAAKAVAADPGNLEAYDDAGVACDRLGRGEEALAWMDRKAARLRDLGDAAPKEHVYRHLANAGTLRIHHWLRTGADRARIGEARRARDEIAAAIVVNPDAHFGRERVQLHAMETILAAPVAADPRVSRAIDLDEPYARPPSGRDGRAAVADAELTGWLGLAVLGAAWQSADVFHTIGNAAARADRSSVALIARLRRDELLAAGATSLLPGAPTGTPLAEWFRAADDGHLMPEHDAELKSWFAAARRANDAWAAAREEFVMGRLRAGRHPDTDPAFWDGWDDGVHPMPRVPGAPVVEQVAAALGAATPAARRNLGWGAAAVALSAAAGLTWFMIRRGRPSAARRRR